MSETIQVRTARAKLMREINVPNVILKNTNENTALEENLIIVDNLKEVIKNNPNTKFIEIIGKHITNGLPLDDWDPSEKYE